MQIRWLEAEVSRDVAAATIERFYDDVAFAAGDARAFDYLILSTLSSLACSGGARL